MDTSVFFVEGVARAKAQRCSICRKQLIGGPTHQSMAGTGEQGEM